MSMGVLPRNLQCALSVSSSPPAACRVAWKSMYELLESAEGGDAHSREPRANDEGDQNMQVLGGRWRRAKSCTRRRLAS